MPRRWRQSLASLDVAEDLVGNAMAFDAKLEVIPLCLIVLHEPGIASGKALWLELINWILCLLAVLQVRRVVLWEVLEECWAVGETHRKLIAAR
eukprot:CAMPEP_0185900446 /NCGR_PEP_ID=MMETSP0196C-20130402/2_1 /TAXON_ID=2932 /ORGANISM="Alexandrium fundyense, Strain CCMP1719" /LENGTH=93 /DNA_ID=CAMNT_0028618885 /DNA_START=36 /DNA_END=315 /DNA_ORIENTATION=+